MKDGGDISDSIAGQRQSPPVRPDRSAVPDVRRENSAGRWNPSYRGAENTDVVNSVFIRLPKERRK